jgi:hypothetical protein
MRWATKSRRRLSVVGLAALLLGGGLVLTVTSPATADPGLTVTDVNPTAALDTGGTGVTVSGTGFTGATAVNFGTVAGTNLIVLSDSSLLVTTPAEPDGVVDVTVVTATGTSAVSSADQMLFVPVGSPPTLTSVTPNAGTTAGGVPFAITGTGFTGTINVFFGASTIPFAVSSDTLISATLPAVPPGVYDIEVQTPNGGTSVTANDRFTVTAPQPVVSAVTPNAGTVDGGESVIIGGSGFTGTSSVAFGTISVPFVVDSDTSITTTAPPSAPGPVDVTVTTPGGGTSTTGPADQFTFTVPPLALSSLNPTSGSSTGGTVVTITGDGFDGTTSVIFGTAAATFVVKSDTSITATSPAAPLGKIDVIVTTPAGTVSTTRRQKFVVVPAPFIKALAPASGSIFGGTAVTILGKGLTGATAVTFGPFPATTFVVNSDKSITAVAPPQGGGPVNVTVTTPIATTVAAVYTYAEPPPVVSAISPKKGSGTGGTSVTITGSNFTGAFAVDFGTIPATIVVNSDSSITAIAPPEPKGTVNVTVTSGFGTSSPEPQARFTFVTPPPVVTSISPSVGPPSGGTTVTITGTNLTGATAVHFGGVAATTFKVSPDGASMTATTPAAPSGSVHVTVTTTLGTSAQGPADLFTYGSVPQVLHLQPKKGPETGGTSVVIIGKSFTDVRAVEFGSTPVVFTVTSVTSITVTSPTGSPGKVPVTVTTANGTSNATVMFKFQK